MFTELKHYILKICNAYQVKDWLICEATPAGETAPVQIIMNCQEKMLQFYDAADKRNLTLGITLTLQIRQNYTLIYGEAESYTALELSTAAAGDGAGLTRNKQDLLDIYCAMSKNFRSYQIMNEKLTDHKNTDIAIKLLGKLARQVR